MRRVVKGWQLGMVAMARGRADGGNHGALPGGLWVGGLPGEGGRPLHAFLPPGPVIVVPAEDLDQGDCRASCDAICDGSTVEESPRITRHVGRASRCCRTSNATNATRHGATHCDGGK